MLGISASESLDERRGKTVGQLRIPDLAPPISPSMAGMMVMPAQTKILKRTEAVRTRPVDTMAVRSVVETRAAT